MSAKSSTGTDAKSYLTFNSSLITLILLPRDAMVSAVYAVVVCLCVCVCLYTPILYQNG